MLNCKYCNKECKNHNSLRNHERLCKDNPERQKSHFESEKFRLSGGNKGQNQFTKAKSEGKILSHSTETKKKIGEWSSKRKHSEETKKKISEKRKQFLNENPDKIPYILNHSSKTSYPEQYFLDCFNDVTDLEFQYPVKRYSLDFANVSEKLYLEIDGEQHYLDNKITEHDITRTETLTKLGWKGIRIRWAEFKKLTNEQKIEKVQEVRLFMKW